MSRDDRQAWSFVSKALQSKNANPLYTPPEVLEKMYDAVLEALSNMSIHNQKKEEEVARGGVIGKSSNVE